MKQGLLWFCGDKYELGDEIEKACERYAQKYGRVANLVYVNPATTGVGLTAHNVEMLPSRSILVHHLWVGEKSK